MNNYLFVILILWPCTLVAATLLNMLISQAFNWSELLFCIFAGICIGYFFMTGTEPAPHAIDQFMLIFSHGLFGLFSVAGIRDFSNRMVLYQWSALFMIAAVIITALLDRLALTIGKSMNTAGFLLSLLIFPLKAPFTLITSGVSLIIFFLFSGIWVAIFRNNTRLGFLGGTPYIEWNFGGNYSFATTLGFTVNTWKGNLSTLLGHELYHTRQYMIFRDWFIPFWLLGGIWGLITSMLSSNPFDIRYFFIAHPSKNIGNPLEQAAYHSGGTKPF
ncbi:hypothetical protein QA601_03375 [Chitinispirillales bacterium ANBcel5]|uniref:hypothetical protein n=1 Tax=Cellulosispirillum alkaliphilum TaxID=3039283 RepID=UPI002A540C7D|nr:hypothetical protein [Chitinispirillales bacterium ANBcel5]